MGQNVIVAGHIRRGIHRSNPQTQNICTLCITHLVGVNNIAQRFRHLATIAIQGKALRHNGLVRSFTISPYRGHKGTHKPTAVLVRTLKIHICWEVQVLTMLAYRRMAHARIPPDIQDVSVGLKVVASTLRTGLCVTQIACRIIGKPSIRTLLTEQLNDTIKRCIIYDRLAAVRTGIRRNWYTPVTLARNTPVWATLDHRSNAITRMCRIKRYVR